MPNDKETIQEVIELEVGIEWNNRIFGVKLTLLLA